MSSDRRRRLLTLIAERDGAWECAYCRVPLVPAGAEDRLCAWEPEQVFTDWCGCGEHTPPEPCVLPASWIKPDGYEWPQLEHRLPRSRGGTDELANLCMSCGDCNAAKRDKTPEEYAAWKAAA